MEISSEKIYKIYDHVTKMMDFMSDIEKTAYKNSQICNELVERVAALETEHESAIDAFEDGFAAGESRSLSRLGYMVKVLSPETQPAPKVEPINWSCRTSATDEGMRSEFIVKSMEDYEKV
ncbi:hypothetical protein IGV50_004428, partial [Salmonella enterica subsp. enterica serovar Newport]|nr:hypothetical protein [Salmonella enterica subsp. enterica serovar Newport]